MIRTLLKPLSFIPAILLMMMIYHFSAQPAEVSSQLSYKVSYKIVETADYVFETNLDYWQMDSWAQRIHGVTRKLAHMTEYFALAIAVSFPLYVYGVHGIWLMLLAGIICVGFATGDEYHQSFVSGRSPSVRDVGIDSFGVFWGIILVRIIGWTGRKTIFRPRKKKAKTKKVKKYNKNNNYNDTYHYNEDEDLPPYNPGGSYPPYQEQPHYQAPPSNWNQPTFRNDAPYQQQPPYQEPPQYTQGHRYYGKDSWKSQQNFQEHPPYPAQSPFPEEPFYGEQSDFQEQPPYDMPPQMEDDDFDYEENDSDKKEPFFMKSAYDGKPKPYDPKDPFQDWMDDYFPEDEDSSK